MPYIGRAPTSTATKLEDADQDTKIQVEESSDEDTIRFDIAGAEDFTMTANTLTALSGSTIATNTIAETTSTSGVTIDGLLIKDSTAAFADGAVGTPSITNTGDLNTGVYFPAADTVGVVAGGTEQFRFGSNPIPGGSKNLVTNGNFTVSQRGTSFADPADNAYTMDRWTGFRYSTSAAYTVTQDTSGVFAAFGSDTALKVDVTTADASIASDMRCTIETRLEAQNLQHLNWGNAAAKDLTLSFCFQSPKSGTHVVILYAQDGTRNYAAQFTVTSADTAQSFSVTIPGDTSGTINNDTGAGMYIYFPLCVGSSESSGSVGSWASGQHYSASGAQNLLDNTANNIYIGLVQLEVGSVATDFAHEDYGTTLQKCQRYGVGFANLGANAIITAAGSASSTTRATVGFWYPTTMRAEPTLTATGSDFQLSDGASSTNMTGFSIAEQSPQMIAINCDVSSGLTQFRPYWLKQDGSSSRSFFLSAEL
jgi:hypothetical protein